MKEQHVHATGTKVNKTPVTYQRLRKNSYAEAHKKQTYRTNRSCSAGKMFAFFVAVAAVTVVSDMCCAINPNPKP